MAQHWLRVEVQVRPTQLLFIFFLLGSCPKQTNRGGKMKGTWRRGKCLARWLDPGKLRAPLERAPAGAPFPAGDPGWAKIPNRQMTLNRDSWEWKNTLPASGNNS